MRTSPSCVSTVALSLCGAGAAVYGGAQCYKDSPDNACNHYHDLDECPDQFAGGGICGNPALSASGQTGTSPTNPSCVVRVYAPDVNGTCVFMTTLTVQVNCNAASGGPCAS
ncbi:MAG: hypothetical protein IT437_09740 [Phycisphaerales bacterium]|nr:hypothetical protein [Phycisphaerales bacterium]